MTLTFATTEIPETARVGRTALPNPFKEHFPSDEKALEVKGVKAESTELNRLIRQARAAAKAVERTARVEVSEPTAKGLVTLKVWTVPQLVRKPREDAPVAE